MNKDKEYIVRLLASIPRRKEEPYHNILVRCSLFRRFGDDRFLEPELNEELLEEAGLK